MPTEIGEVYTQEVLEDFEDANMWTQEEISYEQHIERMDRIRDQRRDTLGHDVRERNELLYNAYITVMGHYGQCEVVVPKKNLIGGELL